MYDKTNFDKTKDLEFSDIYNLTNDMKDLTKNDLNYDHYFIKGTLIEYAKLPPDFRIKALVEHGVQLSDFTWGGFQAHPYYPTIGMSELRKNVINNMEKNSGAYAVGPYIAYAKHNLSPDKIKSEKERLGRNLLVFPAHSTFGVKQVFDMEFFCENIKKIGEEYDSVRICLHWKDVLLKTGEFYKKHGFEVVTAGHYYDPMFLPRLKSMIEVSTMTMSNEVGTHVGYCIYMDKPHYVLDMDVTVRKIE
ncbi:MAG: hypothetical protein LBU40_04060, partial [Methanobrevibacter sp.]|nr:hypothetical protein [Methanobrevibacter sp.]